MEPGTLLLIGVLIVIALKARAATTQSTDPANRAANQLQGTGNFADTGVSTSQRPNTDAVYHILPYGPPITDPTGQEYIVDPFAQQRAVNAEGDTIMVDYAPVDEAPA